MKGKTMQVDYNDPEPEPILGLPLLVGTALIGCLLLYLFWGR